MKYLIRMGQEGKDHDLVCFKKGDHYITVRKAIRPFNQSLSIIPIQEDSEVV